jgi:hypothetical protein
MDGPHMRNGELGEWREEREVDESAAGPVHPVPDPCNARRQFGRSLDPIERSLRAVGASRPSNGRPA